MEDRPQPPAPQDYRPLSCRECSNAVDLGFDFTMAFQPIVDVEARSVFAYEALARGPKGEPFSSVYKHINATNLYRFDQACRVKSVALAAQLSMPARLSINFFPNAVYRPELCIRTTISACEEYSFPKEQIIFEITEQEQVADIDHMKNIVEHYQSVGLKMAIDDFGAGYAGLNVLIKMRPDYLKVDMALIRNIHLDPVKQALVRAVMTMAQELGIEPIYEGVETRDEVHYLRDRGATLFQGYYFAKPAFEALPAIDFK